MSIKILKCSCKHEYQDKKYGASRRVCNETTKKVGTNSVLFRCTVCGKEHS